MNVGPTPDGRPWVLWDGDCGFCRRSVRWLERQDREDLLRTMPYQVAPSPPMNPELYAACDRAVHLILPDGTVMRAGRAALCMLEMVGWGRFARLLAWPPFIWFIELGYRVVADNRQFFSRIMFRSE